jgi:hypothetical protein
MAITKEVLDELLKDYKGPADITGPDGLLKRKRYHPPIFSSLKNPISCTAMEVDHEAAQYERTS